MAPSPSPSAPTPPKQYRPTEHPGSSRLPYSAEHDYRSQPQHPPLKPPPYPHTSSARPPSPRYTQAHSPQAALPYTRHDSATSASSTPAHYGNHPGPHPTYAPHIAQSGPPPPPDRPSSLPNPANEYTPIRAPPPPDPRYQEHHRRLSQGQPRSHPPPQTFMHHPHHPSQSQSGMYPPPPIDTSGQHSYPTPQPQGTPHSHSHWDQQYPPQYQYDQDPNGGSRPRQQPKRAAQACENCRTKKARCDEQRPSCGNCEQNQVKCEYRTVPPPKQDRSMAQLTDFISQQIQLLQQTIFETLDERLPPRNHDNYVPRLSGTVMVKSPTNGTPSSLLDQDRHLSPIYTHGGYSTQFNGVATQEEAKPMLVNASFTSNTSNIQQKYEEIQRTARDVLQGELAIPPVHSTAAHDLRNWPTIKDFFRDVEAKYVRKGEHNHNLDLSIQTPSGVRGSIMSPEIAADDLSAVAKSPNGRTAAPFVHLGSGEGGPTTQPSPGGRNSDQSLSMDRGTALRLLDSYLNNIHTLQPFIDRDSLRSRVERFIRDYCWEPVKSRASQHVGQDPSTFKAANGSKKRKFSQGVSDSADGSARTGVKMPIRRTVDNALLLLVFALGRICEHKGPLPKPVSRQHEAQQQPSPTDSVASPFPTPSSAIAPGAINGPKLEGSPHASQEDCTGWTENLDTLPGAAYFAHAVSILGEVLGGNTILHVQAHLLAALYLAQLVRVYDSWKWISTACVAWLMFFKTIDEDAGRLSDEAKLTYWACLICESDILAELELIPTGLSKLEDKVPIYYMSSHHDDASGLVQMHYLAQASIRKILNRAHSALYNTKKKAEPGHGWAQLNSEQLSTQLEAWRHALPEPLQWQDSDPPADTINGARLRGKYYGARNIIFRPFLHRAINGKLPAEASLQNKDDDANFESETITFRHAFSCIDACTASTIAFDNVPGMKQRLIVTNIFGTAHAQFGNMLVLGAACLARETGPALPPHQMLKLLDRTVEFLGYLAPLSPTMTTNLGVLKSIEKRIRSEFSLPASTGSSFSALDAAKQITNSA